MNLQHRIDLLTRLGEYILSGGEEWEEVKEKAGRENGWFIPAFTDLAVHSIAERFLQRRLLEEWTAAYGLPAENGHPKKTGIIMAGNIPLVGFHDLLCVFICGHHALVKASSRDQVLIKHLVEKLSEWDPAVNDMIRFSDMLKNCDAYIATGSNNSSRYFEYYFGKFPHIIRRNKTSAAILTGKENERELEQLADDVHLYFGLGCRNVTSIFVPQGYDFVPLLEAFKKYSYLSDHHKYKNNFDYNLAVNLLNKNFYMTNGSVLLIENENLFSPISQLNYSFYTNEQSLLDSLKQNPELQCLVGKGHIPFGQAQSPELADYADGVDTMAFLSRL